MNPESHFSLQRSLFADRVLFSDAKIFRFYVWCAGQGMFKPRMVEHNGQPLLLLRRQFYSEYRRMGRVFGVSKSTVHRWTQKLVKAGRLAVKNETKFSVLSVLKHMPSEENIEKRGTLPPENPGRSKGKKRDRKKTEKENVKKRAHKNFSVGGDREPGTEDVGRQAEQPMPIEMMPGHPKQLAGEPIPVFLARVRAWLLTKQPTPTAWQLQREGQREGQRKRAAGAAR